jgi:mannonate dehydratase
MKITEVQVFPVHQFVYVKIETDQGIYGIGEASLSGRSLAVVEALGHIKPLRVICRSATPHQSHKFLDQFRF